MTENSNATRHLRILLAEDNEDLAKITTSILKTKGHEVFHVANADGVLPTVIREQPDLLLQDVMMPSEEGLDGFEICRRIKENPHMRKMPVVILSAIAEGTGKSEEEMRHQAQADAYLHKPFDAERLIELIESLTAE